MNGGCLIDSIIVNMRDVIETGINEQPNKFKYTISIMNLLDKLDITLDDVQGKLYDKAIDEMTRYLIS